MSITVEVIDLTCEQSNRSFFIPIVNMTTKSTSNYATLLGYNEFVPSTPPKKYRKATVSGVSERIGQTMEQSPRPCAGAQYVWGGVGEIDVKGKVLSSYSKKLFAQCAKAYWIPVPIQTDPNQSVRSPCPTSLGCTFIGYCWPPDANSCQACDPNIVNWPLISEVSTNLLPADVLGFLSNQPALTSTTFNVSGQVFAFCQIQVPSFTFNNSDFGNFYSVTVGPNTYQARTLKVTTPPLSFPIVEVDGFLGAFINFVDATALTVTLSEEYTDADAVANATVVQGLGNTASNMPRTTGFVSVTTSVIFTLNMGNLIAGSTYVVTVDFWDKATNFSQHTPMQYTFTATGPTYTIVDVVPTPAPGHTITVQRPSITFAPF